MDLFRKAFLFVVGVVTIGFEETTKAIEKAAKTVEEQREKIADDMTHMQV